MLNSTDISDMKMTSFGYRVDLIRERHVRVKDEAKIESRGTDLDDKHCASSHKNITHLIKNILYSG